MALIGTLSINLNISLSLPLKVLGALFQGLGLLALCLLMLKVTNPTQIVGANLTPDNVAFTLRIIF